LANDLRVVGARKAAEIVHCMNAKIGFDLGESQAMGGTQVHIVTKGEGEATMDECLEELAVFGASEVHYLGER